MTTPLSVSLTAMRRGGVIRRSVPHLAGRDASDRGFPERRPADPEGGAPLVLVGRVAVAALRCPRGLPKAGATPQRLLRLRGRTAPRRARPGVGRPPPPADGRRHGGRGGRVSTRRSNGF